MGGFFGAITKQDCVLDVFFGTDYHSHLGTKRGGMAVYDRKDGFQRQIHNIENTPFRTKFDKDLAEFHGCSGIGCISDTDPQPLLVRSHLGLYWNMALGNFSITVPSISITSAFDILFYLLLPAAADEACYLLIPHRRVVR